MTAPFGFRIVFVIRPAMHDDMVVQKLDIAGLQRHVEIDAGPCRSLGDEADRTCLGLGQMHPGPFH